MSSDKLNAACRPAATRDAEAGLYHPLVISHADARILTGGGGRAETTDYSPLAVETIRRPACSCQLTVVADDPHGNPLNLGRTVRDATWKQIEACLRHDGGCRQGGSRLFLHAHHIKWWDRDQGRTDLNNLVMVCSRCHHLDHEGGWTIHGDPNAELTFTSPTGHVTRSHPHPQRPPGRHGGARSPSTPTTSARKDGGGGGRDASADLATLWCS